jgi:hypothetical protein
MTSTAVIYVTLVRLLGDFDVAISKNTKDRVHPFLAEPEICKNLNGQNTGNPDK